MIIYILNDEKTGVFALTSKRKAVKLALSREPNLLVQEWDTEENPVAILTMVHTND